MFYKGMIKKVCGQRTSVTLICLAIHNIIFFNCVTIVRVNIFIISICVKIINIRYNKPVIQLIKNNSSTDVLLLQPSVTTIIDLLSFII